MSAQFCELLDQPIPIRPLRGSHGLSQRIQYLLLSPDHQSFPFFPKPERNENTNPPTAGVQTLRQINLWAICRVG